MERLPVGGVRNCLTYFGWLSYFLTYDVKIHLEKKTAGAPLMFISLRHILLK